MQGITGAVLTSVTAEPAPAFPQRARCGAEGAECAKWVAKSHRADQNLGPRPRVLAPLPWLHPQPEGQA